MTTALFSNIEKSLLSNIKNTSNNIKIAVAWFTNPTLFKVITDLLQQGKNIEIILADDYINFTNSCINFQRLIDKGVDIRISRFPNLMHHKFCIIDKRILITGSYNWTYNAEKNNHENVILTTDLNLIAQFNLEFKQLKKKTEKLVSISVTKFNSYISEIERNEELNLLSDIEISNVAEPQNEINNDIKIDDDTLELIELANLNYLDGKHQKAIDLCFKILVKYPDLADIYELIASAKWRQGKYNEQIEYAKKAIEIDNLFYDAYNILGIGYSHIKNSQKSIENYQICISAEPDEYVYHRNRALSYLELEKDYSIPKKLREQFERKSKLDLHKTIELTNRFGKTDSTYKLYYSRGIAHFHLDQLFQAKKDLEKAVQLYELADKMDKDSNELKEIKQTIKDIVSMR